jgi:siderophore synthetase component
MNILNTNLKMFTREAWERANLLLLSKMLREFIYEEIINPYEVEKGKYVSTFNWEDTEGTLYIFKAKKRMFDSYEVLPETIKILSKNKESLSYSKAVNLLLSLCLDGKVTSSTAGHLVKEYFQTLVADLHLDYNAKPVNQLVDMSYEDLEGEMKGHPWITYNKGRIGFMYEDYLKFAPEQKNAVNLSWIAVHKEVGSFHSLEDLSYSDVINQELSQKNKSAFNKTLKQLGLNTDNYYYMPIHEWQWNNMIVPLYAEYIANQFIIPVGESDDYYLPQQSIRTFVNVSNRDKYHVKLPMSILNTLVYRGLPSERTVIAPQVTKHIKDLRENDPFLRDQCKIGLLGEVATMNVDQKTFLRIPGVPYQYLEMLGVVWRESIYQELKENEQAITLAALLHIDGDGNALVSEYIKKSGMSSRGWVDSLMRAILPPLLHYLYKYGTVFSPHGQNTVLVLKNGKPERIIMKDFVDDVNISDQPIPELIELPSELKQVLRSEPPQGLTQFILTGLFICHFRYLSDILEKYEGISESNFWWSVRKEILDYQSKFPDLKERFEMFDLLQPSFVKLTLNRNRMFDYGYEDDNDRPHASEFGKVKNALHEVKDINLLDI